MKKLISFILILSILMTIYIVPSFASDFYGYSTCVYVRFKDGTSTKYYNNSTSDGYTHNVGSYYVVSCWKHELYDGQVITHSSSKAHTIYEYQVKSISSHKTQSSLDYYIMLEEMENNPIEAIDIYRDWLAEFYEDNTIVDLYRLRRDRLLEELGLGFLVQWKNEKIEKIKTSLNLGADLLVDSLENFIVNTKFKIANLFNNPYDEQYIIDNSKDITNNFNINIGNTYNITIGDNYSEYLSVDTYFERQVDENDTVTFRYYAFNHDDGTLIDSDTINPVYDEETETYDLPYEFSGTVIPYDSGTSGNQQRGIYKVESYQVAYPNGIKYDSNNPYIPKQNSTYRSSSPISTGRIAVGSEEDIQEAISQNNYDSDNPKDDLGLLSKIVNLLEEIKVEIQNLFISGEDENGNPLGFLGVLDHLSGLAANIFDFIGTGVGGVGEVISEAVGEAIGNTVGNIRIPTGFLLGLPKFIIMIGGVLISLVGIMLRFVVFITTLWNVEPTSELLSVEMIDSINYVRFMPIPVFGNLYMLTISLITVLAGFMIIKTIRRYEING